MSVNKPNLYYRLALIFAIWFALTGSAWTYYMNLVIAYPFGILSFLLWNRGRKMDSKAGHYKAVGIILIIGIVISLIALLLFLFYG